MYATSKSKNRQQERGRERERGRELKSERESERESYTLHVNDGPAKYTANTSIFLI